MADISLWVSIFGFIGQLIPIMSLDFRFAAPPAVQGSPATRRLTKIQGDDRYMVMSVNFGVIRAAEIDVITFSFPCPARLQRVNRAARQYTKIQIR